MTTRTYTVRPHPAPSLAEQYRAMGIQVVRPRPVSRVRGWYATARNCDGSLISLSPLLDVARPTLSVVRNSEPMSCAIRSAERRSGYLGRVMAGHFAVWDRWTEIENRNEGHFMERLQRG